MVDSTPESIKKTKSRSGDRKFLFSGLSNRSGLVQYFLLVMFFVVF